MVRHCADSCAPSHGRKVKHVLSPSESLPSGLPCAGSKRVPQISPLWALDYGAKSSARHRDSSCLRHSAASARNTAELGDKARRWSTGRFSSHQPWRPSVLGHHCDRPQLALQNKDFRCIEAFVITLCADRYGRPLLGRVIPGFAPTTQTIANPDMLYLALGIIGASSYYCDVEF
jgi:hypothetical protein